MAHSRSNRFRPKVGSSLVALVVALSCAATGPAWAQFSVDTTPSATTLSAQPAVGAANGGATMSVAPSSDTISHVDVVGNQRIEAETVRAYMTIKAGDSFDGARMDESLKRLFSTGLFADVALARRGDDLIVKVVENPIINRVAFEGNRHVEDDQLDKEVQLKARQVYTRTKVQEDVKRILNVYRRSGRFAVTVDPKIIELDQNRVDLVFEINEGPSTYIRRINFVGNKKFSDHALREVISSREERWYRFFSSSDTYDPDRMTYDRELLRRFYLKNGYSDFRVASAVAELSPERDSFFMTFTIDEGERYKFGDLDVDVSIPNVKPDVLKAVIVGHKGDWYNADEVEDTVQAMTDVLGTMGYAFVDVRPRVRRDRKGRMVNVTYTIQEGPKVFVDRIDISGNVRTLDKVIRREMDLMEGDAFNAAKLRESKKEIQNLGFFSKVDVTNVPSETSPDRTVVKVDVEEKSTGELSFGVGYSTSDGALFDISMRERNLLGRGQDLKVSGSIAESGQNISLAFTEPYFLNRPLAAGFDLFSTVKDYQDEASYDLAELGFALRLGFKYDRHLSQGFKYRLSQTTIEDVDDDASKYIQQIEGKSVLSQVSQSLTYNRLDSNVDPTDGFYVKLGTDVAGLGGDEQFVRGTISGGQYFPIDDGVVLNLKGKVGAIQGIGKDVLLQRNFYLGGDNLRGFEYGGASARDSDTDDILGGTWIANGSVEMRFPLGLPKELGVTGKAFTDFGASGSPDGVDDSTVDSDTSLRLSAGVGLVWVSPMGPVSIDMAQAILKESYDETEFFRFNFGTSF